jgi:cGMP-dependent protein kinase
LVEKGSCFGDHWLHAKNSNEKLKKKIVFSDDSLLAEIGFKEIFDCIGGPIEVIFEKNKDSHEVKYMKRANSKEINKYIHLKLEDMISIKKLGKDTHT